MRGALRANPLERMTLPQIIDELNKTDASESAKLLDDSYLTELSINSFCRKMIKYYKKSEPDADESIDFGRVVKFLFGKFDTNNDGKISKEELKIGLADVLGQDISGIKWDQIIHNLFVSIDKDFSDNIEEVELLSCFLNLTSLSTSSSSSSGSTWHTVASEN